jgi:hypothetical protein
MNVSLVDADRFARTYRLSAPGAGRRDPRRRTHRVINAFGGASVLIM